MPRSRPTPRARQLDPSLGFSLRAWLLVMNGQANEALVVVERAFSIDPLAVGNYQLQKCWASFLLGRYDEAITACEKWRAIDDGWFPPHVLLMAAYAQSGNAAKAAAEKAIVLRRVPEYSIARYKALWKSDSPAYQSQTGSTHHRRPAQGRNTGAVGRNDYSRRINANAVTIIATKNTSVQPAIARPEEFPALLRALAAACEDFFTTSRYGIVSIMYEKPMPARGHLVLGSACSHTCLPANAAPAPANTSDQAGVDRRAEVARIVDECHKKNDADRGHCDPLEDAQRAGLEAVTVLQPQRPAHQPGTDKKSQQIRKPVRGGSRISASDATPIVATPMR